MEKLTNPCIFPGGARDKEPPANAGDVREAGLIPRSGRSLKKEMATHSSILAWKAPWTEEPDIQKLLPIQEILFFLKTALCKRSIYWVGQKVH